MVGLSKKLLNEDLGARVERCESHGDFESKGAKTSWGEWWTTCPKCEEEREAKRLADEQRANQEAAERFVQNAVKQAGIPMRFRDRGFRNFAVTSEAQKEALKISKEFVEDWEGTYKRGDFLIFEGKPGTGKTHLACAIAHNLLRCGYTAAYMNAIDALRVLRDTWRKGSDRTELQALEYFESIDLLILDEIGVQFSTEAEKTQLFDVLNRRYRECKPTILLTNLNMEGVKDVLGERTFDRFREVAKVVSFNWESYRKSGNSVSREA